MNKEIPEKILVKLRNLMKLQEGAKKIGSLHEAETIGLKIQEILINYNLELHQINKDEETSKVGRETLDPIVLNKKNEGKWLFNLYKTIAEHNFCKIIYTEISIPYTLEKEEYEAKRNQLEKIEKKYGRIDEWYKLRREIRERWFHGKYGIEDNVVESLILIGEPINVEVTKYTVDQLSNKVRPLAKDEWKKYDSWPKYSLDDEPKEKRGAFIRGFYEGFVLGIGRKLYEQEERMKKANPEIKDMSLMLVNKVEKFVEENIPTKPRNGKREGSGSNIGHITGFKKGLETNIDKGLNTNSLNQKLLS